MTDAQEAIIDVEEAIEEFGSTIVLNLVDKGEYDPNTGDYATTTTSVPMKALIQNYTVDELNRDDVGLDDVKFKLYYNASIENPCTVEYNGKTHKIISISSMVLQDLTIIYTLQGRA